MTLPEQTALVLDAARDGIVQMSQLKEWACSVIESLPQPPLWIIEIATTGSNTADDFFQVLKQNAGALSARRAVQAVLLKWAGSGNTVLDALPAVFRKVFLDPEIEASAGNEPLENALVQWDCQDDLDRIPPALEEKFLSIFADYLMDASDVARVLQLDRSAREVIPASPPPE